VNPKQTIQLSVGVNTQSVTYQWIKGGGRNSQALTDSSRISGANTGTLTIHTAEEGDEGSYMVLITNNSGLGRLTSNTAKVVVNDPVQITSQPKALATAYVPGKALSFRVDATGTGPLSYQWTKNGNPIPGEYQYVPDCLTDVERRR